MKTVEDFKKAAKERNITRWNIHECSMCGYACGYVIRGDNVGYDNGCNCVWGGIRPSSWQELTNAYNMNAGALDRKEREKNPLFKESVEADDKYWGFDS